MRAAARRSWWSWVVGLAVVGLALGVWGVLTRPSAVADEGGGEPDQNEEKTLDLDINTHDKPRTDGVPTVSRPEDITGADEPREMTPGGYIWVNDDNDHNTGQGDDKLDRADQNYAGDNDLEPLKYTLPDDMDGWEAEICCSDPDVLRIWQDQAKTQRFMFPSGVAWVPFEDCADPGLLYAEGMKPYQLPVTVGLRLKKTSTGEIGPSDQVRVTIYGVRQVKWETNFGDMEWTSVEEDPTTNRPDVGTPGYRVFPDFQHPPPDSTGRHDRPLVRVEVYPNYAPDPTWEIPVYVRAWDVDHYSADEDFDMNGMRDPGDNVTGYTSYIIGQGEQGNQFHIGLGVVGNSVAKVLVATGQDLQFAMRVQPSFQGSVAKLEIVEPTPCNNWRLSAGCGDKMCDAVRISVDDANGAFRGESLEYIDDTLLHHDPLLNPTDTSTPSTRTLTVWRKLYLEEDRMSVVDWTEGPFEDLSLKGGNATDFSNIWIKTDMPVRMANQFEDGLCHCYDDYLWYWLGDFLGTIDIHENSASEEGATFYLTALVPDGTEYIYVQDDDVTECVGYIPTISPKVEPMRGQCSAWNNDDLFPDACVVVDTTTLNSYDSDAPFDLNTDLWPIQNALAAKGITGGNLFWVATLLGSYQPDNEMGIYGPKTNDPDMGGGTMGVALTYYDCGVLLGVPWDMRQLGAVGTGLAFREVVRDGPNPANFVTEYEGTCLHEIAHTMGARDNEGGVMNSAMLRYFSPQTLRRLMLLQDEGPSHFY